MTNETTKNTFDTLQKDIIQKMLDHGISEINVKYYGSGDSSDGLEITAYERESEVELPFSENEAEQLLWSCIRESGLEGWENNAGGRGQLTIKSNGVISLEHFDYIEESSYSESLNLLETNGSIEKTNGSIDAAENEANLKNHAALLHAMNLHNIHSIEVHYDGGGDSGSVENIYFIDGDEKENNSFGSVKIKAAHALWVRDEDSHLKKVIEKEMPIFDLVDNLWCSAINSAYQGWENSWGAFGKFLIFNNGKDKLEHNERYEESTQTDHEWFVDVSELNINQRALPRPGVR